MIKNNYFTKEYQTFLERLKLESLEEYLNLYQKAYSTYKSNMAQYYSNYINQLKSFAAEKGEEIPDSDNDADLENNLFDEYASFDTNPELASSGYTTILSDNEDNRESNNLISIGGGIKDNKNNIFNNLLCNNSADNHNNNDKYEAYESSNFPSDKQRQSTNNKTNKNISSNVLNPNSLNADGQACDRLNNLKINKNQLTIRPRTKEEIKEFQRQELERYKKPHLPWKYVHPDGSSSVVAPVQKKIPSSGQTKPRDHVLLKGDRPSYVTILCLARDAAARLPEGVGTRADICDLLKESQYTNERLSDAQINNIVSGALDRLHYEKDPCVKYDLQKKLWIYLHKSRTLDYEPWNEHLKKNTYTSNAVDLSNPAGAILNYDKNNNENYAEESGTENENKDDGEDLCSNFNIDEKLKNEKKFEFNNDADSDDPGFDSSKAENALIALDEFDNKSNESDVKITKKSKWSVKAVEKKAAAASRNGNIICISKDYEFQTANDLNLNEKNSAAYELKINDSYDNKSGINNKFNYL